MKDRKLYLGPLTDNRRWDRVKIRPDDVMVVTPPKCGTTWMQTIVALLLSGDPEVETELTVKMPWVDIRLREVDGVAAHLAQMTHRRSMKSHTPMDGLPLHEEAHYICVFRHPLDAHFSFRNHAQNIPMPWFAHWYPEEDDTRVAFRRFLDGGAEGFDMDLMPLAHIIRHYHAAKALADRPNVTLFHYADMMRDLAGTFRKLDALLDTDVRADVLEELISVASFEHMKSNASRYAPGGGQGFFKSDSGFFQSGGTGKWQGQLTDDELAAYDAAMDSYLAPADRAWLEHGAG